MRRPALLQSMQKCTTVLQNPWAERFTKIRVFVHKFMYLCFNAINSLGAALAQVLRSALGSTQCAFSVQAGTIRDGSGLKLDNACPTRKQRKQKKDKHDDKQQNRQNKNSGFSRKQETQTDRVPEVFVENYKYDNQTGYQP